MTEQIQKQPAAPNVVFIGKKPNMSYVLGVLTQFNSGQTQVHLKARGKAISKCVDVAEIVRNKFVKDVKVNEIQIGTEQVSGAAAEKRGKDTIGVSVMEIVLAK